MKNSENTASSFYTASGTSPTLSEFLSAFDYPDGKVRIRALGEGIGASEDIFEIASLTYDDPALLDLNEERNVYFVVNASAGTQQFTKDEHITRFTAAFCEMDSGDIEEQRRKLAASPLLPSITVYSGGKSLHAYWLLSGGCSKDEWQDMQRRLIAYFNGDQAIKNPSRILRLPGFRHLTTGNAATIERFEPSSRYTIAELQSAFPAPLEPERKRPSSATESRREAPINSDIIPPPAIALTRYERPKVFLIDGEHPERQHKSIKLAEHTDGFIKPGTHRRYEALRAMAHTFRKHYGAEYDELLRALEEDNEKFNHPPLEQSRLESLAADTVERIDYALDWEIEAVEDYWFEKRRKVGEIAKKYRDIAQWREAGAPFLESKPEAAAEEKTKGESKATQLVKLADDAELFCEPDGNGDKAYATVSFGDHFQTHSINSKEFRLWLTGRYFDRHQEAVSAQPMQDAINTLAAKAYRSTSRHKVFNRIGEADGKLYYDLGDERWRVVEIDADGWRILDKSPVKFVRPGGYKAQVAPVRGGSIDELRRFINVSSDDDWTLLVGWLISSFRPTGAYALLSLAGTQDAAKSTTTKMIRLLIDPSTALVRAQPKEERDLMIGAKNNWLLAFDNLSHIQEWLSDALCRVSTGGGQSNRKLYEDGTEYAFEVMRPVVMNGIEELATRPDLADRTINVFLPSLDDSKRKDEKTLYAEYSEALPRILGGIFDVLSVAIKNLPNTRLDRMPRMADVARFVTAAEPALGWEPGTFLKVYEDYRREARINALEASHIGTAVLSLMGGRATWEGSAAELLNALDDELPASVGRRNFPTNARSLSGALRRIVPNLKEVRIEIEFPEKKVRKNGVVGRIITIINNAYDAHQKPNSAEFRIVTEAELGLDEVVASLDIAIAA